jgi:hypothetical protein
MISQVIICGIPEEIEKEYGRILKDAHLKM